MQEKFIKAKLKDLDKQNLITLSVEIRQNIKDNQSMIRDTSNKIFRIDIFTKSSADYLRLLNYNNEIRWLALEIVEMIEKLTEIKNIMVLKNFTT